MAQVMSRRAVTAKAGVRSKLCPCGICGGKLAPRQVFFFPNTLGPSYQHIPPVLHTHSFFCHRRCMVSVINSVIKQRTKNY